MEQVAEYVCATFEINSSWAPYIGRAGRETETESVRVCAWNVGSLDRMACEEKSKREI